MLALLGVWIGLGSFGLAIAMLVYRATFTDLNVTLVLYFGSPGSLCLAGLVLWAFRKEDTSDEAVQSQRLQAKVAIAFALLAAAIVYAIVIYSDKFEPIESQALTIYNAARTLI